VNVADNHRHWPADARGVYEVWYLTWNHAPTGQGFWLRYITEAPKDGPPRAELWFARFDPTRPERTFGIHKQFAAAELATTTEPFAIEIAGSRLGHDHAIGQLAGGGHDVRWELRWQPAERAMRLLPDVMYAGGGRGETTVLSPNWRVPLSGTLVVDGEQLAFDRAVMGQTHLWGKKHAYSWTWGHVGEFAGAPDAVLELLGVRIRRRGLTLPPMTLLTLDLDGEHYRLNQFRHVVRNRSTWGGSRVTFAARSMTVKIEGELVCTPDQMVAAPYLDPDGTEVFCSNTEIGDAHVTVWKRAGFGWREVRRLDSKGRAHFEIGGRMRDPAVVRDHVLV
jgi:hypothetical protein